MKVPLSRMATPISPPRARPNGLAGAQGGQMAAPGDVPRPVEGQQARLDADVLDVDGVAAHDIVLAGVLERDPLLGGIEDQRFVAAADIIARVGQADHLTGCHAHTQQRHRVIGRQGAATVAAPVPLVDPVGGGKGWHALVGKEGVELRGLGVGVAAIVDQPEVGAGDLVAAQGQVESACNSAGLSVGRPLTSSVPYCTPGIGAQPGGGSLATKGR